MTAAGLKPTITYFVNKHSTIWINWPTGWAEFWALICTVHLIVSYYHVTYAFQSESILYICVSVKKLLAWNNGNIWSLSDYNRTQNHNHLVRKRKLDHLAKLIKLLSFIVSTYLYGAFDCMLLSCHLCILEWIHTLYLPECQGTYCSKQVWYMKVKWL